MQSSSIWSTEGRGSKGMGCTGCKPEIWRGAVSCTVWPCCPGLTVVAWSGISHVQTFWQPVTWNVLCYLLALRRTRLNVGKWWNIAHCGLDTAPCQWQSSYLVCWARRRTTSSATSDTGSHLWQLSRGHSSSWCSGWVSQYNVAKPRVCWELFWLQSDWTNCFIYSFKLWLTAINWRLFKLSNIKFCMNVLKFRYRWTYLLHIDCTVHFLIRRRQLH